MQIIYLSFFFAVLLFGGVLVCMHVGWKVGRKRLQALGEDGQAGLGAIDGAVFGLMGLLIAFTFTGAAVRFDARRNMLTQHVNAIGTAWLRLDLLAELEREKARDGFRRYVDTQMEIVRNAGSHSNQEAVSAGVARLSAIQEEVWAILIQAFKSDRSLPLAQVVLPPANEMFDLSTTRLMASHQHPPMAVFVMLGLIMLVSSLLAGYGMAKAKQQSVLHVFGFAGIMAISVDALCSDC
jgi:hypothetical protein